MVLGGQYVVVTVSWLSEENTYIERGKEKRRQGGNVLRKRDEGDFLAIVSLLLRSPSTQSFAVRGRLHLGSMKWLLGFVGGMVAYSFLKMLAAYSTRKQREEAWRMMAEGRNEEAREMRHRNSTMKMNDTPDWDTIDRAEVDDSRDLVKIVLSRVIEKQVLSAAKQRRIGNWKRWLLLIRIHMKLELIMSKIPALPHLPYFMEAHSACPFNYSIEEIVWSDISLIHGQSVANTAVSPVEEKVSALLTQEAIHPYTKKKAMRPLRTSSTEQNSTQKEVGWDLPRDFFRAFGKFKSQDKLAVEMDKIYAKIQNLSIHRPTAVNPQGQVGTQSLPWVLPPESHDSQQRKNLISPALMMMRSDGCRLQLRNKEELMESLTVLDDSHLLYDMLEVLPDTLNGSRMILTTCETILPPNLKMKSDPHQLRLRTDEEKALSHKDATLEEWSTALQQFHHDQQQLWPSTLYKIHKDLSLDLVQPEARMKLQKMLQKGTNKIRRLVDHLDKEDISFDHIHKANQEKKVGNFLRQSISSGCFLVLLVLDLENVFRPKLPEAIGKLTRLRYLGLRSTFLEILPSSLSKLQNVQTLDMKHTCINTLPNSILEATTIATLTLELLDIRKLGLTVSSKQEAITLQLQAVVDWVLKLNQLRSLRLKSIDESNQPWDLELKPLVSLVNLSYILIDLTLSGSGLVEDPMQSLDKLPNLRSLKLLAKSYLGKNMLCSLGGFPQLRVLKLWKLEQLEEWNVEKGALRALRDLEIRFCRSLKNSSCRIAA
ncbi:putative disease resistance protein [Vitis vinifera]|uniref:Putative disease resistance protein n=1 Tax=Vitis vinifera TaxID=29760 RepID=A0A438I542_VITVI|nr:putative disease resistance protein [Vitis vinifera]